MNSTHFIPPCTGGGFQLEPGNWKSGNPIRNCVARTRHSSSEITIHRMHNRETSQVRRSFGGHWRPISGSSCSNATWQKYVLRLSSCFDLCKYEFLSSDLSENWQFFYNNYKCKLSACWFAKWKFSIIVQWVQLWFSHSRMQMMSMVL